MEQFIHQNGYLLVFVTVAFSGEFGLFTGVALARSGSVSLWGVIILGTLASFVGNSIYFYAGKFIWHKWAFLRRKLSDRVEKTATPIRRFGSSLMLVARFFYGVRNVVPIALGVYNVRGLPFMVYNLTGAFIWAWVFTEGGNLLSGHLISAFAGFRVGLLWGIVASLILLLLYFAVRKGRSKLKERT